MTERVGPLIKGQESIETGNPNECKFFTHLIFFYTDIPAYDYPICLHPKVCRSAYSDRPYYRTEDIGCNLDNCPFAQKIEAGRFSELTFEDLAQEEIVQLPETARFRLKYEPIWVVPPPDFEEKATWKLFSPKEAAKIEDLSKRLDTSGFDKIVALCELGMILNKHAERKKEGEER